MNSDETPTPNNDSISQSSDDLPVFFTEESTVTEPSNQAEAQSPELEQVIIAEVVETSEVESLEPTLVTEVSVEQSQPLDQLSVQVTELEYQKQVLETEIKALQDYKNQLLSEQTQEVQETLGRMVKEGLRELEMRKQELEISIEQLERRRERIREEMRTTFAGVSQDLAIRVQGFKDYLVGSLQDLAAAAEQLELPSFDEWERPSPREIQPERTQEAPKPQFAEGEFQDQTRQIQRILEQYRTRPDYYGPPWQLRRTFEPIHAERVQNWFFSQGGRGAIKTMGSRLQNILVGSAVISVLHNIYGDRSRTLILANTPERLGEWRRGLQDCLGISRSDFGPERGIVLFEAAEALIQKADRLVEEKRLPLVIIDETEERINLSLLQFPLWLAFAPDPQQMSSYMY